MTSSTSTGHENPGTVVGTGRALSEGSTTVTMSGAPTVVSMIWGVLSTVADGTTYGPMVKHKAVALLRLSSLGLFSIGRDTTLKRIRL
jgi:hypothetical protein